jgi:hypothetical protein
MRALSLTLLALLAAPFVGRPANAQPNVAGRELVGFVRDAKGTALEGAAVEILGATTRTNAGGAFRLWTSDTDTITITVKRLGFSAVSALVSARNRQWDTVVVEMDALPQRLAAAEVKAAAVTRRNGLRDFEQRRARGPGQYFTRDEIIARRTNRASDVVRQARGVLLVRLRAGGFGVRFASHSERRATCAPMLWLDGLRTRGMELDDIAASDIEALELYESWTNTPSQFSEGTTLPCGTIVVWTRAPGGG